MEGGRDGGREGEVGRGGGKGRSVRNLTGVNGVRLGVGVESVNKRGDETAK